MIASWLAARPPRSRATLYLVFPTRGPELQPLIVAPEALAEYRGSYAGERDFRVTFSVQEGHLAVVNERRSDWIALYPLSRTEFVSGGMRLRFTFARDASGTLTSVLVSEGDRRMVATRAR